VTSESARVYFALQVIGPHHPGRQVWRVTNLGKLIDGAAHLQAHRAAAERANSSKLVITHFDPSPTKDTRF
jgi:hypothetical protein